MSQPTDKSQATAGSREIAAVTDVQVFALASVLGANVRHALDEALGAERWLENTCVDFHPFPITLGQLNAYRLPALSVWRVQTATKRAKKRTERRATFAVRYWLDESQVDWLPKVWPMLHAVSEVITRTLTGDSVLDLSTPGPDGEHTLDSSSLLTLAGFTHIDENSIIAREDFAVGESGNAGNLFPVVEVSFEAEHLPLFGGLPYSCEFPNGVELPEFIGMCFSLWDGTPVGGRPPGNQPIVQGKTVSTATLEERSRALLAISEETP